MKKMQAVFPHLMSRNFQFGPWFDCAPFERGLSKGAQVCVFELAGKEGSCAVAVGEEGLAQLCQRTGLASAVGIGTVA